MELNKKQKEGLELAVTRYINKEKITVIAGYAGTGKSTLVKFIISALEKYDVDSEKDVVYTSFTGKATQVLQKKGNKNVKTLHKLLYDFYPRSNGTFFKKPVDYISYKIVIVDECSMVPKELFNQLLKYPVHIICLGDPGQLPPVDKSDDNELLINPHIFLDEIMRQEEQSEIIQLTMKIRAGEELKTFKGKEVQILEYKDLTSGMLLWADQIICSTNATRVELNQKIRDLLNKNGKPQDGDKIICLRNYWDIFSNNLSPLVNGTIGYLKNTQELSISIPKYITNDRLKSIDTINCDFISDDDISIYNNLLIDKKMILENEPTLNFKESFKMSKNEELKDLVPLSFTYAYAITCHKSQGSEWDNVLVIEESFPFDKDEHIKWLYTACTRAAKKLVIIKKG